MLSRDDFFEVLEHNGLLFWRRQSWPSGSAPRVFVPVSRGGTSHGPLFSHSSVSVLQDKLSFLPHLVQHGGSHCPFPWVHSFCIFNIVLQKDIV